MKRVFSVLDEKKDIERRRKTWNLKKTEQKIEKVRKKRTEWNYLAPKISIKRKLEAIFENNLSDSNKEHTGGGGSSSGCVMKDSNERAMVQDVPVNLALSQSITQVIDE